MKLGKPLLILSFCACTILAGSESVTLNEAEDMVKSGRAVLVKLPSDTKLLIQAAQAEKTEDLNKTAVVPVNIQLSEPIKVTKKKSSNEGVSILMPTTLTNVLSRLSKLTGENYYTEDEINVPSSEVKIKDFDHLSRYLKQVSNYSLVIQRESDDPSIPMVIKVIKTASVKAK